MAIDRDLWLDTFYQRQQFAKDGIAPGEYEHSALRQ